MSPRALENRRESWLHVARLIGETTPNTQALEYARHVDEQFIQKGRFGVASGQGFYSYPNPAFAQPGFRWPWTRTWLLGRR